MSPLNQPTEEPLIAPRPWCRDRRGRGYSFNEFLKLIESFHGYPAPGVLIGAKMVDIAMRRMPAGVLFDVVCESSKCLPDAVQLLTPCTLGNGWLRVQPLGRYALTLFGKRNGRGIRVFLGIGYAMLDMAALDEKCRPRPTAGSIGPT